jgi:hypothetical protein
LAIFDFIMMIKTPIFISNSFNEGPLYGKFGQVIICHFIYE